ncbi:MAG: hypothetical protein OXG23_10500 [Chloroflexi bacterium]|nr:hypothetical protein [Chloroflexota bacterium]
MNVARLIESSFNEATKALTMGTSQRSLARARERAFTKAIIAQLRREFDGEDHRVFATTQRGNAADFATNQLLYDIAVCRIGAGKTAERKSEDFHFIAQALWQVEIDFSREWRQTLYAINRLNCGGAADKLLITARLARSQAQFLETLRAPSAAVDGALYLAFVAHPADWDDDADAPQVWRIVEDDWGEIT